MQSQKAASPPFFSIVIANYNYGRMLRSAIESILHQDCQDFEIIIVDGGSNDESVDIIKEYQNRLSWWVSEPDNGQSEAFNKGFRQAKGLFISWLNADDILLPGTLDAVKRKLLKYPYADYATGNYLRFLNDSHRIIEAKWGPHYLPRWLQGAGRFNPIYGPTVFWRKSLYDELGPIDESLHYTMDVEYWARLQMHGCIQVRINHYCWGFRMHTSSKTAEFGDHRRDPQVRNKMELENAYILKKHRNYIQKKWRILGYIMRLFDGSAIRMIYNNLYYRNRVITSCFKIDFNL